MSSPEILKLEEVDPDIIPPSTKNMFDPKQGGAKIVVIGKPGTGKTTIITSLIYEKQHIFPVALIMSGTEASNGYYQEKFPSTFVYNKLREDKIEDFKKRQHIAKKHLEYPWAILLLDDVTDQPSILKKPLFLDKYKNGRHWKMWSILSLQYSMDVPPSVRTAIDGVFILREPILKNRRSLYENYAGIIPDFNTFCEIMDQVTDDFTALYIHNATTTNNWKDCIFWYKAVPIPEGFKFGCQDYWNFHEQRYNPDYIEPV